MKLKFTFVIFIATSFSLVAQYISVDDQRTAQDLVENVLLNNSGCASISNFSVSGGNFPTGENSYGYFNATGTTFPFAEGLILSTGKAMDCPGPNTGMEISGTAPGWTGLDVNSASVLGENNTNNATTLEFDFVPLVDYMSFEYIFLSEEYQNGLMCTYSDVFGFLIKKASEPDSAYVNIALIPNTTIPVKVTTVHPDDTSSPNCGPENEIYFGGFNIGTTSPTAFDGQTVALLAESVVEPNEVYHIKLIIADDQDEVYDSAVFLKAGSFNIGTNLGDDRVLASNNVVCGDEIIVLDSGVGSSFQWYKNGVILAAETNQILQVDSSLGSGIYSVAVDLGGGCIANGDIELEFYPIPVLQDTTITSCRDVATNVATFDLTDASITAFIINNDPNLQIDSYYRTMVDAENNNAIATPNSFETATHQPVYVKVINAISNCVNYATLTLDILEFPELDVDEDVFYCTNTYPNFIEIKSGLIDTADPLAYSYSWLPNGETTSNIFVNVSGDYVVTVTNVATGCAKDRIIHVKESSIPVIDKVYIADTKYPDRFHVEVLVTGQGNYIYGLDIDPLDIDNDDLFQIENYFENVRFGSHIVTVKDKNGCNLAQENVLILYYPKFVTPNNDGKYDTWNIDNINTLVKYKAISNIFIFDRFGTRVAEINPRGLGWNGMYNGQKAAPDDYWFVVELQDYSGKRITKRGHFSLN